MAAAAARGDPLAAVELKAPELPEVCAHIWTWYRELSSGRSYSEYGANPIGWVDIEAWARLTRRDLKAWEVEWLRLLDAEWLAGKDANGPADQRPS